MVKCIRGDFVKKKIFYLISVCIIIYCIFILSDYNVLFTEPKSTFGRNLQIYLPLVSISFATIIYGIGCLLEKNK